MLDGDALVTLTRRSYVHGFILAGAVAAVASSLVSGQALQSPPPSLCTTTVTLPPPAGRGGGAAPPGGAAPAAPAAAPAPDPTDLPRLTKVTDDFYVMQNANHNMVDQRAFGGNVAIYVTPAGVILFDSKYDRMHDHIVQAVKSVTSQPIKYLVLTHNHNDHSGGVARMQALGVTALISTEDRRHLLRMRKDGLPEMTYSRQANMFLGEKEVQLREFCGHTSGDTVAYLPGPRVLVGGDLVVTAEEIPQIVNYGDGGNWTDLIRSLNEIEKIDFDLVVGGHGPPLKKEEFRKHVAKMRGIYDRFRMLVREGLGPNEIVARMSKEFNWGEGPSAGQIAPMMIELK